MKPAAGSERGGYGRFALTALATWRLTHLIAYEDGPADLVAKMRARIGDSPWAALVDCFACLSIWIAALFTPSVARRIRDAPLVLLALSGAACLLERMVPKAAELEYYEPDKEESDVLRSEQNGSDEVG